MTTQRPNIILVMTDNQAADMLGCAGNHELHTPNLDALAEGGMRFANAYCPNAMCSPSRASVWTGRMPCQHGVHTWLDDRLISQWPEGWSAIAEFDTLPQILGRRGYATAMIGKYHLGRLERAQQGIGHWVTMERGHTLDFYGNRMRVNDRVFVHDGHSVDFFTEQAVQYLASRAASPGEPFLLLLPYNGPYGHWPSVRGPARNPFWARYADLPMDSIPREGLCRSAVELFQLNTTYHSKKSGGPDFSALLQAPNDLTTLRNYYSQISVIDHGVGHVMDALAAHGLDRNTVVVFTADHGFSLGHHGFWGHGQATWPSNAFRVAYNIPLLVWGPGLVEPGTVADAFVSSTDLFATLLAVAGLADAVDLAGIPSRSFAPLLAGRTSGWTDEVFIEQEETRAIRTPGWSYFKRFAGSRTYPLTNELYDLTRDPDERTNLAGRDEHRTREAELSRRIDEFFGACADPRYDLWRGGSAKSNSSRPWLWRDAWGDDWRCVT